MSVYKVSGIWRYRFMLSGRRYFKALPEIETKSQARAAEEARKTHIREGRDGEASADTNFRAFVNGVFLPWVETNLARGTCQSYRWRCADLIEVFGALDLAEVSQIAIERFKREQLKRKTKRGAAQSTASVNRYLQILASVFTRAESLGLSRRDGRPRIETLREDNARIRYLTLAEESALRGAAAEAWPYLADLIAVGCATGLRRAELFALRKADIDLTLNLVHVLDGKGGKARTVPLDPAGEARQILAGLIAESRSDWIFTSPHSGGKFTRADKSLAKASKLAEVEGVTLHVLRHTFCTRLAAAGVDVRTIKELAGHADISTTMRYMHLVESNTHAAIRKLTTFREDYHKIATKNVVELKSKAG